MFARVCASCKFSTTDLAPDKSIVRFCRRHPPQLNLLLTQQGPLVMSHNPQVKDDFWCGEFEKRLDS